MVNKLVAKLLDVKDDVGGGHGGTSQTNCEDSVRDSQSLFSPFVIARPTARAQSHDQRQAERRMNPCTTRFFYTQKLQKNYEHGLLSSHYRQENFRKGYLA
jgi:hypothetical protein